MGDALGGGHSVRYGTSYVSRHCIRIGTVLEQLNGGTATRVADAADAADADFIVPHAARTHTSHAQGPRLGARTCLPLLHPAHCSSLSLSLSSRSSGRSAACGKMRPSTSVPYQPSCTGMGCFSSESACFFDGPAATLPMPCHSERRSNGSRIALLYRN